MKANHVNAYLAIIGVGVLILGMSLLLITSWMTEAHFCATETPSCPDYSYLQITVQSYAAIAVMALGIILIGSSMIRMQMQSAKRSQTKQQTVNSR